MQGVHKKDITFGECSSFNFYFNERGLSSCKSIDYKI